MSLLSIPLLAQLRSAANPAPTAPMPQQMQQAMPGQAAGSPLDALKDIHYPDAITWWPLAMGWWFVIITTVLVLAISIWAFVKWMKKRAYRKAALSELALLDSAKLSNPDYLQAIAALVRKTAISAHIRNARHLQGADWQELLALSMPKQQAHLIAIGRYLPQPSFSQDDVSKAVKSWIKSHQQEKTSTSLKGHQ